MAKKYSELRARMSPEAQARAGERTRQMLADMPLQELRQALRLSQETLAETLGISQPQVSKIEHRTDLYLSTLRRYIEAMNGQLEVVARFAEGVVRITQFQAIEPEESSGAIRRVALRELPEELSEGWRADQSPSWAAGEVSGGKGMSKGLTPQIVPGGRCAA